MTLLAALICTPSLVAQWFRNGKEDYCEESHDYRSCEATISNGDTLRGSNRIFRPEMVRP